MLLSKKQGFKLILPPEPTPREQFAGRELERYLLRIFGTPEGEKTPILIGGPGRNPATAKVITLEEFKGLCTGEEGFLLRITPDAILIAGSEDRNDRERGTLYGVYEFLERYLGCTLAAYSHPELAAGEVVPQAEAVELPEEQYVKAGADRPYRTAIVQYGDSAGNPAHQLNLPFLDWLSKNRYNRILTWGSVYEKYKKQGFLPELEKRGLNLSVGHHEAAFMWLPYFGNEMFPEPYGTTHPEFFRLNEDGTRYRPESERDPFGQWIYCSRNMECIETISRNIIRWIDENPLVDCIAFWPKDGKWEQCSCPKCAPYSKIENYTFFQNEVAKRVSAVHPRMKIDMLVYVDLWECPKGVTLSPNLFVDEATWAATGLRTCGKPDGSCLIGTDFDENLAAWRATGAQTVYYDYYMGVYSNRQRIVPMADEIQSLWQHYAKVGIAGSGTQIECFNLWNHLLNFYTFGRTAYDHSRSFKENLTALCGLFGEGAPFVAEALELMEATLDGQVIIQQGGRYLARHIDGDRVYDLFERALAAARDRVSRNNIRLMRMAFRYSMIETRDEANREYRKYRPLFDYEDPAGELAWMATHYDSFKGNDPGYGIDIPVENTDCKGFVPDHWYQFE